MTSPGDNAVGRVPKRTPQLHPLTTFRFFAALAIVVFHSVGSERYSYLSCGVSFFFILSGFVLTYVHPRLDGRMSTCRFWVARLARIWPLHLLTLIYVVIFQPFGHRPFKHFFGEFLLNASLLQCWVPVRRIAMSFNFVSWSLSVEMFFYLVFPLVLPLVFKAPGRMFLGSLSLYFLLLLGAGLAGLPDHGGDGSVTYQSFLFCPALHLYEFVLGMALSVWWLASRHEPKEFVRWSLIELILFGGALWLIPLFQGLAKYVAQQNFGHGLDWQLEGMLNAAVFAVLIYFFAYQAGVLSRIFSQAWLVYLGDISFTIYMVHCIVLQGFLDRNPSSMTAPKWGYFGLALLCACALVYGLFEKPIRTLIIGTADSLLGYKRPSQVASKFKELKNPS